MKILTILLLLSPALASAAIRSTQLLGIVALFIGLIPGVMVAADSSTRPHVMLQLPEPNEPGTPLVITGELRDHDGRPVAGAQLHIYQTDATGSYTREKPMDEPHARLNGTLSLDTDGKFELRTIRPGGYPQAVHLGNRDRHIPEHIHIDITAPGHDYRQLQVVFADDKLLADSYWADWVVKLRQPVLITHAAPDGSLTGTLVITLD